MSAVWQDLDNTLADIDSAAGDFSARYRDCIDHAKQYATTIERDARNSLRQATDARETIRDDFRRAAGEVNRTKEELLTALRQKVSSFSSPEAQACVAAVTAELESVTADIQGFARQADETFETESRTATAAWEQHSQRFSEAAAALATTLDGAGNGTETACRGAADEGRQTLAAVKKQIAGAAAALKESLLARRSEFENILKQVAAGAAGTREEVLGMVTAARDTQGQAVDKAQKELTGNAGTLKQQIDAARAMVTDAEAQIEAAITAIVEQQEKLVNGALDQVAKFKARIDAAVDAANGALEGILSGIGDFKDQLLGAFATLQTELAKLEELFDTIKSTLEGILAKAMGVLDAIPAKGIPEPLVNKTIGAIEGAVTKVSDQLNKAGQKAGDQINKMADQITKQVSAVREQVLPKIEEFSRKAQEQIQEIVKKVQEQIRQVIEQIQQVIDAALEQVNKLTDQVVEQVEKIKTQVKEAVDKLSGTIESGITALQEKMSQLIARIRKAIAGARQQATDAVSGFIDSVTARLDGLENRLQTAFPLDRLRAAKDKIEPLAKEISAAIADQFAAVRSPIEEAAAAFKEQVQQKPARVSELLEALSSAEPNPVADFREGLSTFATQVRAKFDALTDSPPALGALAGELKALRGTLTGPAPAVLQALRLNRQTAMLAEIFGQATIPLRAPAPLAGGEVQLRQLQGSFVSQIRSIGSMVTFPALG